MPKPSGCPFAPEPNELVAGFTGDGYTGPDTEFKTEGETTDAGTVTFPTPLANDQYTYFTLEAPPYGTTIVAGEVNDTIATKLTTQTEPPTEEARLTLLTPVNVTDKATIIGPNAEIRRRRKSELQGLLRPRLHQRPVANSTEESRNGGENVEELTSKPVGASAARRNATYYWQVEVHGQHHSEGRTRPKKTSPATRACVRRGVEMSFRSSCRWSPRCQRRRAGRAPASLCPRLPSGHRHGGGHRRTANQSDGWAERVRDLDRISRASLERVVHHRSRERGVP